MRKKNALFLFFCLFFLKVAGQDNSPDLQKIVPPSPNAAALGKFADMPVNTHTGIPKVSVPVYNWADNNSGLNLNISLDYHAGGVKVEEIASNVGLGWALNAGGVITRTMRGLPDEDGGGFLTTPVLPNIATTAYNGEFIYPDIMTGVSQYSPYYVLDRKNTSNFSILENYLKNDIDTQQDIFYYNFNGRSGKFFIGKDGSILLQTKDNLKIVPIKSGGNKLYTFEIIDDKGILYIFSARENTNSQSRTEGSSAIVPMYSYISSWYLSAIKSADGLQQITFDYESYKQDYETGFSESWSINYNDDPSTVEFDQYLKTNHSHSYNYTGIDGLRLKTILLPDFNKVEFAYSSTAREDVHLDQALNKITIVNGSRSFGVALTQSYFDSGNTAMGYYNKRLRLDNVTEFGNNGSKKPYQFIYYGSSLPTRNSVNQDYWGYALMRNNKTRISQIGVANDQSLLSAFLDGADRSPDPNGVKAASLVEIVYPTGGSTEFEMESNQGFGENYASTQKNQFINFNQDGGHLNYSVNLNEAISTAITMRFKITEISRVKPDPNTPIDFPEEAIDNAPVSIVLSKSDQSWSTVLYTGTYEGAKAFTIANLSIPAAGSYYLRFNYEDLSRVIFTVATTVRYEVEPQDKIAGGIRIKKMINRPDEINGHELVKEYNYTLLNGKSSGKLAVAPNYNYYKTTVATCVDPVFLVHHGFLETISRSSESTQPLGSVQGSPIGYSRVMVIERNNGQSNGQTIYEFTPLEYFDSVDYYPYSPGEYISWGAGLPLKEETYSASGMLLRSLENTYDIHYDKYISEQYRSLKVANIFKDNCRPNSENRYTAIASYPVYGMAQKTLQKERVFDGTAYVETLSDYIYEPVYNQLTETRVKTSTGTVINKLFYPYQYTGVPVLQDLTAKNRVAEPVKNEIWKVNNEIPVLTGGTATTYEWKDSQLRKSKIYEMNLKSPLTGASISFDPSQQLSPAGSYEAKLSFEKYNEKGAPVFALTNGKVKSSWIWAADGIHLNASVNNADQTEIYFENFELTGNSAAAHTGKKGYTGNFTPGFNVPNGKTYLVSYWSLNGDKWVFSGELPYTNQVLSGTIDDVKIHPSDAYMTTYTHEPLAGISSSTDPKGQTTYYEYDNFLRLLNIKDRQNNIIKNNIYNYKP